MLSMYLPSTPSYRPLSLSGWRHCSDLLSLRPPIHPSPRLWPRTMPLSPKKQSHHLLPHRLGRTLQIVSQHHIPPLTTTSMMEQAGKGAQRIAKRQRSWSRTSPWSPREFWLFPLTTIKAVTLDSFHFIVCKTGSVIASIESIPYWIENQSTYCRWVDTEMWKSLNWIKFAIGLVGLGCLIVLAVRYVTFYSRMIRYGAVILARHLHVTLTNCIWT